MFRALELASHARGDVEPNPMVGAVLVRDGQIIAEGHHQKFGGPHAEVVALADARSRGIDPAGATLYVTLEPCCHHGKTPPCTDAILAANIRNVVAAMVDPDPRVAGNGIARLRAAGVSVEIGDGESQARSLNAPFLKRLATGLPWVIVKWAQTLDGKVATRGGDSQWISGEASRRWVHQLRARVDAIAVGIGTALRDNPTLTARDVEIHRIARRVVVDPSLRLPADSILTTQATQVRPVAADGKNLAGLLLAFDPRKVASDSIAHLTDTWQSRGVDLLALPPLPQGDALDLRPLLAHLAVEGASNVMVEGGPGLLGHLLGQKLVDELAVFVAPRVLGDAGAMSAVAGVERERIDQADRFRLVEVEQFEGDVLMRYRVG